MEITTTNEVESYEGWGTFYCIGTGPGDPELITLKAIRHLQSAAVVLVPHQGEGKNSQAYTIIRDYVDENCQQVIPLLFPMTRKIEELETAWDNALTVAAKWLALGQDVVFPVLGDPLLYGTFNYLHRKIKHFYPLARLEIVPGITSFQAAAALAQIPLAEGAERVAIVPALYEENPDQFRETVTGFETVVLMKVGGALDRLLPLMEAEGWLENSVYLERVGLEGERVVKGQAISGLKGSRLPYFSLMLIKKGGGVEAG